MRSTLLKFLIPMLILTSCGDSNIAPVDPYVPQDTYILDIDGFEDYVFDFEADAREYGNLDIEIVDLIIDFKDIEDQNTDKENKTIILGQCFIAPNQTPVIYIDNIHWASLNEISRKLLMHHELGHCILERSHEDDAPSIMSTQLLNSAAYSRNKEYYLEELFDSSKFNTVYSLMLGFE